jgi:PAS domain S-box-containing protein
VNNPLPVDRFSVADAARRTWPALIESMLDAVCLVEPEGLRIVAANGAAGRLFGVEPAALVGRDMHATAATPEDEIFWREVGATRERGAGIVSASFVVTAAGAAVPVVRRVSRIEPAPGTALYVVALHDRSEELRAARHGAVVVAQLAATLESVRDGVLVIDLAGHINNFNRRFAALWSLPDEMLVLRADDEILDWMRGQVDEPAAYMRRLAEIDGDGLMQATDLLRLRSGVQLERSTLPQRSQGRPIGRVFTFRRIDAPVG